MICMHCAEAADNNKPDRHRECPGRGWCDCRHRTADPEPAEPQNKAWRTFDDRPIPHTTPPARGDCARCGHSFRLYRNGTVWVHKRESGHLSGGRKYRCPGSQAPPAGEPSRWPQSPAKQAGECSACGRVVRLNGNGTVRYHKHEGAYCPGVARPPA